MSATAPARVRRPTLATRIAAVAVVIALAALAAYAVFSGPTRVPANGSGAAPVTTIQPGGGEPEGGGGSAGEHGD